MIAEVPWVPASFFFFFFHACLIFGTAHQTRGLRESIRFIKQTNKIGVLLVQVFCLFCVGAIINKEMIK